MPSQDVGTRISSIALNKNINIIQYNYFLNGYNLSDKRVFMKYNITSFRRIPTL